MLNSSESFIIAMKQYELKRLMTKFTERFNQLYKNKTESRDENGRKFTMYRISREIGISDTTLRKYLEGVGTPSFENLLAIMEYFEVSFDWLIGRDNYQSEAVAEGVEKYGLSEKAAMNLVKARNGEVVTDTGDYSIETFNPIVSGDLDLKPTFLADDMIAQNPVRMVTKKDRYDETLVQQELRTMNVMIEDWTIIRKINAYIHSTPQDFAKLAKYNYFELDLFQLEAVNKDLKRKKDREFAETMSKRPDAYKIRIGADGNVRMMTGRKW